MRSHRRPWLQVLTPNTPPHTLRTRTPHTLKTLGNINLYADNGPFIGIENRYFRLGNAGKRIHITFYRLLRLLLLAFEARLFRLFKAALPLVNTSLCHHVG